MTNEIELLKVKNPEDRIFEGILTVEVVDKDGEVVPVEEVADTMNTLMKRGGFIIDSHSNRVVGKLLNWAEGVDKKKRPMVKVTGQIFKDWNIDDDVWDKIKTGKYKGLSFGGSSTDKEIYQEGSLSYNKLKNIEGYEVSVCENPANQEALITAVNMLAKSEGKFIADKVRDSGGIKGSYRKYLKPGEEPPKDKTPHSEARGGRYYLVFRRDTRIDEMGEKQEKVVVEERARGNEEAFVSDDFREKIYPLVQVTKDDIKVMAEKVKEKLPPEVRERMESFMKEVNESNDRYELGDDTLKKYTIPETNKINPERLKEWDSISEDIKAMNYEKENILIPAGRDGKPLLVVACGTMGAGKSQVLSGKYPDNQFMKCDVDEVRVKFSDFSPEKSAEFHRESKILTNKITDELLDEYLKKGEGMPNVLLETTGQGGLESKIKLYQDKGYDVIVEGIFIPAEVSMERSVRRWVEAKTEADKRLSNLGMVGGMAGRCAKGIEAINEKPGIRCNLYWGDVEYGEPYQQLFQKHFDSEEFNKIIKFLKSSEDGVETDESPMPPYDAPDEDWFDYISQICSAMGYEEDEIKSVIAGYKTYLDDLPEIKYGPVDMESQSESQFEEKKKQYDDSGIDEIKSMYKKFHSKFAGYKDFASCVKNQEKQGKSEEEAVDVCSYLLDNFREEDIESEGFIDDEYFTDEEADELIEEEMKKNKGCERKMNKNEVMKNVLMKGRKYISSPSEAPEGADVQEGPRGGYYYDSGARGQEMARRKPAKPPKGEVSIEDWVPDEMEMWSNNIESLQRTRSAWIDNFARKKKRGNFDRDLAIQGIANNFVPQVISEYNKESYDKIGRTSGADKRKIAEAIFDGIEWEIDEKVEGMGKSRIHKSFDSCVKGRIFKGDSEEEAMAVCDVIDKNYSGKSIEKAIEIEYNNLVKEGIIKKNIKK